MLFFFCYIKNQSVEQEISLIEEGRSKMMNLFLLERFSFKVMKKKYYK